MGSFSIWHWIIVLAVVLILFGGGGKISRLAGDLAGGIKSFRKMLDYNARQTPLRRNVTIDEVGNAGAFLCSDLASGISGEILYVDGGFNTTAMGTLE